MIAVLCHRRTSALFKAVNETHNSGEKHSFVLSAGTATAAEDAVCFFFWLVLGGGGGLGPLCVNVVIKLGRLQQDDVCLPACTVCSELTQGNTRRISLR